MRFVLILLLILSAHLSAKAACTLESPFPFPVSVDTLESLEGMVLRTDSKKLQFQMVINLAGRPSALYFQIYTPKHRRGAIVKATLQGKAFCGRYEGTKICIGTEENHLLVKLESVQSCSLLRFYREDEIMNH